MGLLEQTNIIFVQYMNLNIFFLKSFILFIYRQTNI